MKEIIRYAKMQEKDYLKTLRNFLAQKSVKIPATADYPFGKDIHQMFQVFSEAAENVLGTTVHRCGDYYAWVEIGDPNLPLIGIVGHLDVVNYEENNWEHDPLGEVDGETLFGRGVVDNKGPIVQSLYAMKYVLEKKRPLRIRLIVGGNEESDFLCVKKYLQNQEEMPQYGYIPDAKFPFVIGEKGIINVTFKLTAEQFGVPVVTINGGTGTNILPDMAHALMTNGAIIATKGVAGHAANDVKDPNAIIEIFKLLAKQADHASFLKNIEAHISGNILTYTYMGMAIIIKPTMIIGDDKYIQISIDARIPSILEADAVWKFLRQQFQIQDTQVLRKNIASGYEYDQCHPMVKKISQTYTQALKILRPHQAITSPLRIAGTTYAKYFPNCITFGPGFPNERSYGHAEDERITRQSFRDGLCIYIQLLENLTT
ncbi:M20/M25/M40 family metallo-hydrolase [Allofustis seminis]|uniref:M20/M25/M40 family metallo-hydrolase n=1 Tax=Allofustis seminis TaxID=166939 RepID=UPI00036E58CE|nr:M20/M25/M40 family metallo-hydrolase [Allofustis seminis]